VFCLARITGTRHGLSCASPSIRGIFSQLEDGARINVGTQINNPGQPLDRYEPRIFEIGKISNVRVTETAFKADARFDRFDPRYKGGIICSV
jgi:hypothetical protein